MAPVCQGGRVPELTRREASAERAREWAGFARPGERRSVAVFTGAESAPDSPALEKP